MPKAINKVNRLLCLGREIESTMPELVQLRYEIKEVDKEEIAEIAEKFNSPFLNPSFNHIDYRTTVLDGKIKIVVRSKPVQVTYQITD